MSKPSYSYKLPCRSIAAVKYALDDVITRAERRKVKFQDRIVSGEAVMNAVVLHFLGLPIEEQDRIVNDGVPRFEALTLLPDVPGDLPEPAAPPSTSAEIKDDRPEPKKRRKSGGN